MRLRTRSARALVLAFAESEGGVDDWKRRGTRKEMGFCRSLRGIITLELLFRWNGVWGGVEAFCRLGYAKSIAFVFAGVQQRCLTILQSRSVLFYSNSIDGIIKSRENG